MLFRSHIRTRMKSRSSRQVKYLSGLSERRTWSVSSGVGQSHLLDKQTVGLLLSAPRHRGERGSTLTPEGGDLRRQNTTHHSSMLTAGHGTLGLVF